MLDKFIFKDLSRKIWEKAQYVTANSGGLRDLAILTAPGQKIDVIYNGVDIKEFTIGTGKKAAGRIKLISTSRLIKRKGYEYLIRALKDRDDLELSVIGDGNIGEELRRLAQENNAPVIFLGEKGHSDIKYHLQGADIFVLPSLNEGMSNSLLEAMASGLAVVATDVGGVRELVRGNNGFIVRKGSADDIAYALNKYKENKELIEIHGRASRKIAEEMSWGIVAEKYRALYELTAQYKKGEQ